MSDNKDENTLRNPTGMLNIHHRSAHSNQMNCFKNDFIVMLLFNSDPKNKPVYETIFVAKNKANNVLFFRIAAEIWNGAELTLPRSSCGPIDDSFPVPGC